MRATRNMAGALGWRAWILGALVAAGMLLSPSAARAAAPTATEFGGVTAGGNPEEIAVGPDGNLWFTEFNGDRIGRINTETTEPAVSTPVTAGPGTTAGKKCKEGEEEEGEQQRRCGGEEEVQEEEEVTAGAASAMGSRGH